MCLDAVILSYSTVCLGLFELSCPEATQVLFKFTYRLLLSLIFHSGAGEPHALKYVFCVIPSYAALR